MNSTKTIAAKRELPVLLSLMLYRGRYYDPAAASSLHSKPPGYFNEVHLMLKGQKPVTVYRKLPLIIPGGL